MGFFNPGKSKKWYLGIWYKKISNGTVVWVANRDTPMNDSSGSVKLNVSGSLVLLDSSNRTVWSSIVNRSVQNPVLQLLDSGNLVVRAAEDQNSEDYLWQSFDYPTDTHLPGMKLGKNAATGKEWYITSWKSKDDPGRGPYKYWMDLTGYPQIFMSNGSTDLYRSGPWNGLRYSGTPSLRPNPIYTYGMYFQKNEVYYR
ncbi:unnamed protein product [Thlaspi arvense]|uniref:Bulb-type lectin domain-containing protein n=1 Tax=Thlaspi arvense TaxID=13288 RepID=A0AAU9S2W9_THLAR|nr:unnamed protein product [Thlaspi arvense]